jgi:60 kDa SS-A/Ro ribonucleoprotein
MTRMNLNTFARHSAFGEAGVTRAVAQRLRDHDEIRRARVFPYQLLVAHSQVDEKVPAEVRDALEAAMEIAIENVPSIPGGVVVCPDVSGSMQTPVTGYRVGATTAVRCVDVAALVAAAFRRKNADCKVLPFSDGVVPCALGRNDTVLRNAKKLASLPSGGTNCSAPLVALNKEHFQAELVVMVSDNMSWVDSAQGGRGTATMQAWAHYKVRNPRARLVCLDIQPGVSTQAEECADILNVGGFSDAVFEIIARFAQGELAPDHWVGEIEKIEV